MRGYKGFNKNLSCDRGKGTFQYEIGKTYKEDKAQTAMTGFHFTEEPLEVLKWYPNGRYCMIEASGDIDEIEDKISCTEITIIKELTLKELYAMEVKFILDNPKRNTSWAKKEKGTAKKGESVLVIGEDPKAKGKKGSGLFMIQKKCGKIIRAAGYLVDGKEYKPDVFYNVKGEAVG